MSMSEEPRKVFTAGVGAVVITGEKTKEIFDTLSAKGDQTMKQTTQARPDHVGNTEADEDAQAELEVKQEGLRLWKILEGIGSFALEEVTSPEDKLVALKSRQ